MMDGKIFQSNKRMTKAASAIADAALFMMFEVVCYRYDLLDREVDLFTG